MLPRVNSVCSYPLPYRDHGCEHYMSYTPPPSVCSLVTLLVCPMRRVLGGLFPQAGGSLCFLLTLGVETTGLERGECRRGSRGGYSSVNSGLEKAFCGGVSGSYCSLELFATFATTLGGASSSCAVIADQQT